MFHLARHRSQFIANIDLDPEAMKTYQDAKTKTPSATFILSTQTKENLNDLAAHKKTFKATISIQDPDTKKE